MYATARMLALLGVTMALTALLLAGAMCCIDAAVACADENDHRPQTATQVLPTSARAVAWTPTRTVFGESRVIATVCAREAGERSIRQAARLQLRI